MATDHATGPKPKSDHQELEESLTQLADQRQAWADADLETRIDLLSDIRQRAVSIMPDVVRGGLDAKGIDPESPAAADEWLATGVSVTRTLRLTEETLRKLDKHQQRPPVRGGAIDQRANGQVTVDVLPLSMWDRLAYRGFSAKLWLDPSIDRDDAQDHFAAFHRQPTPRPARTCLVLGAGNVASIPLLDAIYKMFVEGQTCMVKLHPLTDYLLADARRMFQPAIDKGWVKFTTGDADAGDYLCNHDIVDTIHITGSHHTHDAIVFGTGDEGEQRKRERRPKLDKPITSELGNVTPVIVVPGPWSDSDLDAQAANIATQLANNSGFNCNAIRVLVVPEHWDRRAALLERIEQKLADIGTRSAWYPGARNRYDKFVDSHDDVDTIGDPADDELPWAILKDVPHDDHEHLAFREESFCSVTAETRLPGDSPTEFLETAVDFCNNVLWGTLGASILIHPETQRSTEKAVEQAIADLEYGTVALNHWIAISYAIGATGWGAYPGHTYSDIQSGIGFVHNALMVDSIDKNVLRGPFRPTPTPPWYSTNPMGPRIAPALVELEAEPSISNAASSIWSAVTG
jgi:acyl-CoA reductase-like NAD-dependent aldehyde dehydrogenase